MLSLRHANRLSSLLSLSSSIPIHTPSLTTIITVQPQTITSFRTLRTSSRTTSQSSAPKPRIQARQRPLLSPSPSELSLSPLPPPSPSLQTILQTLITRRKDHLKKYLAHQALLKKEGNEKIKKGPAKFKAGSKDVMNCDVSILKIVDDYYDTFSQLKLPDDDDSFYLTPPEVTLLHAAAIKSCSNLGDIAKCERSLFSLISMLDHGQRLSNKILEDVLSTYNRNDNRNHNRNHTARGDVDSFKDSEFQKLVESMLDIDTTGVSPLIGTLLSSSSSPAEQSQSSLSTLESLKQPNLSGPHIRLLPAIMSLGPVTPQTSKPRASLYLLYYSLRQGYNVHSKMFTLLFSNLQTSVRSTTCLLSAMEDTIPPPFGHDHGTDSVSHGWVQPQVSHYAIVISTLGLNSKTDDAIKMLSHMKTRDRLPSQECYQSAISACGRAGRPLDGTFILLSTMGANGMVPNEHCYQACIRSTSTYVKLNSSGNEIRQYKAAVSLIRDANRKGVQVQTGSYGWCLKGCYMAKDFDEACEVFKLWLGFDGKHVDKRVITQFRFCCLQEYQNDWIDTRTDFIQSLRPDDNNIIPGSICVEEKVRRLSHWNKALDILQGYTLRLDKEEDWREGGKFHNIDGLKGMEAEVFNEKEKLKLTWGDVL